MLFLYGAFQHVTDCLSQYVRVSRRMLLISCCILGICFHTSKSTDKHPPPSRYAIGPPRLFSSRRRKSKSQSKRKKVASFDASLLSLFGATSRLRFLFHNLIFSAHTRTLLAAVPSCRQLSSFEATTDGRTITIIQDMSSLSDMHDPGRPNDRS